MPQKSQIDEGENEQEQEVSLEEQKVSGALEKQNWDELVSTGLTFLNKLGQVLFDKKVRFPELMSEVFSGLKIETDKATGRRHLNLPIPGKEVLLGVADLINEFSKRL